MNTQVAFGQNEPPNLTADEALRLALAERSADLIKRRDDLLAGIARAPATIEDDDTAGTMGDFSQKQIAACLKAFENKRIDEKAPFLSAERTVDGYFHEATKPLIDGKAMIDKRRKKYLDDKAAEERRVRQEAERIAREEAQRKAAEAAAVARKIQDEADLNNAIAAEEAAKRAAAEAEQAAKAAAAKPADLSRVRGTYGSVSSLTQFWDFKDIDRETIDLEALRQHLPMAALEQAVRAIIKAGTRELRGVTIYENTRL